MSHGICPRHPTAIVGQSCSSCGHGMCEECTVPMTGQAAMCLPCALSRAGVRASRTKRMSWWSRRRDAKVARQLAEEARTAHDDAARWVAGEETGFVAAPPPPAPPDASRDWASPTWHS